MKPIHTLITALLALSPAAMADDYTLFHVCQDQRVIHTTDGADAGHVEYVVIDPGSQRVVSTVVTGGVIGEKFVAVPYESMHFDADRQVVLENITREQFVSAPVIERTQINTTVIQPTVLERTSQHFGVRFNANVNVREDNRVRDDRRGNDPALSARERNDTERNRTDAERNRNDPAAERERNSRDPAATAGRNGSPKENEKTPSVTKRGSGGAAEETESNRKNTQGRDPNAPPAGRSKAESAEERNNPQQKNRTAENPPTEKSQTQGKNAAEKSKSEADSPPSTTSKEKANAESGAAKSETENAKGRAEHESSARPEEHSSSKAAKEKSSDKAESTSAAEKPQASKAGHRTERSEDEPKRRNQQ